MMMVGGGGGVFFGCFGAGSVRKWSQVGWWLMDGR